MCGEGVVVGEGDVGPVEDHDAGEDDDCDEEQSLLEKLHGKQGSRCGSGGGNFAWFGGLPRDAGLGGFALEGGLLGGRVAGFGGGTGVGVGGLARVFLVRGLFAEGLETGGLGAESADLLRGGFGDEVAHERNFIADGD